RIGLAGQRPHHVERPRVDLLAVDRLPSRIVAARPLRVGERQIAARRGELRTAGRLGVAVARAEDETLASQRRSGLSETEAQNVGDRAAAKRLAPPVLGVA